MNLTAGGTYYFKVTVTDNAGNSATSTVREKIVGSTSSGDTGDGDDEGKIAYLPTDDYDSLIGTYVDYSYDAGSYSVGNFNTTSTAATTYSSETGLEWRIYNIDGTTLTLISSCSYRPGVDVRPYASMGYTNGVYVLNNMCKALFSNSNLKLYARSINAEDIDKVSTFDKYSYCDSNRNVLWYIFYV